MAMTNDGQLEMSREGAPGPEIPSTRSRYDELPLMGGLSVLGDIATFGIRTAWDVPKAIRLYPYEVIRIAASLVTSSTLVLLAFMALIGLEASILAYYLLTSLGATDYAGLFTAIAGVQAASSATFCWILAAKVGCGFSAEIGTMRITEEIDAVQVMGLSPRIYLVSTRIAAAWLVLPFTWLLAICGGYTAFSYIGSMALKATSPGGYFDVYWAFQRPEAIMLALAGSMITATVIVMVSCYFGYHAEGGPVGVGRATALSMGTNMVLVSLLCGFFFQLFFGLNLKLPIAN